MKPIAYDEALRIVLDAARRLAPAEVSLELALGLVLAEDAVARVPNPPFDDSAMDGYAVRCDALSAASREREVRLGLCDEASVAGLSSRPALPPNTAMRTLTGAPIPRGADAVVRQEATRIEGREVVFWAPAREGENVRRAGEDVSVGEVIARKGDVLGPGAIAALAAVGVSRPRVFPRPRVALVTLGDELAPSGAPLRPGQRYDCNAPGLAAAIIEAGGAPSAIGPLRDEPAALREAFAEALAFDVVVTAGGISVGDRDHVASAMESLGVRWLVRGIRMKPGHPASFGVAESDGRVVPIFGLPGNPAAALVAFEVLARPALRAMLGHVSPHRPRVRARVARGLEKKGGSDLFLRGALVGRGCELVFEAHERQGAGMLASMTRPTALARVAAESTQLRAGAAVEVSLLGPPPCIAPRPIIAFVGPSGSGKTTLLERVVSLMRADGRRVAALKHDVHGFDFDREGSDTARLRAAGADVAIVGPDSIGALMARPPDADLELLAARLFPEADLVLVEGFHGSNVPKVLVLDGRGPEPRDEACVRDVLAVVGQPLGDLPSFARGDAEGLAALLRRQLHATK